MKIDTMGHFTWKTMWYSKLFFCLYKFFEQIDARVRSRGGGEGGAPHPPLDDLQLSKISSILQKKHTRQLSPFFGGAPPSKKTLHWHNGNYFKKLLPTKI